MVERWRENDLLIFRARSKILCEHRLRLSDDTISRGQWLQPRQNPMAPKGKFGVVWRGCVGVEKK
jgi:hypothetical protein